MSKVYIVRHGNTFDAGDVVTRVGARTDLPLSNSGRAQAGALAEHFARHGITFAAACCSPLARTRQTAEAVLARQGSAIAISTEEFLREIDYGPDENVAEEAVVARIGQEALHRWEASAIAPDGWIVDRAAIVAGWGRLLAGARGAPGNLLVVTSNGIARFLAQVPGLQVACPLPDLKLKTAAYAVVATGSDGAPTLTHWNLRA